MTPPKISDDKEAYSFSGMKTNLKKYFDPFDFF